MSMTVAHQPQQQEPFPSDLVVSPSPIGRVRLMGAVGSFGNLVAFGSLRALFQGLPSFRTH